MVCDLPTISRDEEDKEIEMGGSTNVDHCIPQIVEQAVNPGDEVAWVDTVLDKENMLEVLHFVTLFDLGSTLQRPVTEYIHAHMDSPELWFRYVHKVVELN